MSEDIVDLPAPEAGVRLAYGPDPQQFGDLRLPAGKGPHPVAIILHGGYWRARYDLAHIGHLCAALTTSGLATWNVEYRRLGNPGGGWPGTLSDVALAADHLHTLEPTYRLDLARVVSVGHSAGGQLALWLAGRHRIPAESAVYSVEPLPLAGVVALAAVCDLERAWELRLSRGVVEELLNGSPTSVPERYAAASPAALLPLGVPQVLVHGTEDADVPHALSSDYHARALARGDDARLLTLPGAGHFEPIDPRAGEWPSIRQAVLALSLTAS
jgi:acetyl esterase/lipase